MRTLTQLEDHEKNAIDVRVRVLVSQFVDKASVTEVQTIQRIIDGMEAAVKENGNTCPFCDEKNKHLPTCPVQVAISVLSTKTSVFKTELKDALRELAEKYDVDPEALLAGVIHNLPTLSDGWRK